MILNAQILKCVFKETVLIHVYLTTHVEPMQTANQGLIEQFVHVSQITRAIPM